MKIDHEIINEKILLDVESNLTLQQIKDIDLLIKNINSYKELMYYKLDFDEILKQNMIDSIMESL